MKEVLTPEAPPAPKKESRNNSGEFVLDSKSDKEHHIFTGHCVACNKEFSIFVPKADKHCGADATEAAEELLSAGLCHNCRG